MRALVLALGIGIVLGLACERGAEPGTSHAAGSEPTPAAEPATAHKQPPPLPSFEGTTLDGERVRAADLLGRRTVIFFFNPDVDDAAAAAEAVRAVAAERQANNFRILGVALAGEPEQVRRFAAEHGLDFPILYDASGAIAQRFALRAPLAFVGSDAEGRLAFAFGAAGLDDMDAATVIEERLRTVLRLPSRHGGAAPVLGERPAAPDFEAERIDGASTVRLADLRGRPVVLIFFLHTCPHCHEALETLRKELAALPEEKRPLLVGVSVSPRTQPVRERLRADGLDFFPVVVDPDRSIQDAYGVLSGVPDIFLIDAGGRIVARTQGWRGERDPALMRMRLAKLAGEPVPMLLHTSGYSGNDVCSVCHELEHETWVLTQHASAYDTLVRHGEDRNPECVGCHVVGFGQPGGWSLDQPAPWLEDVGCEDCHGRGGPHLSPGLVRDGNYEPVCVTCHDTKHSLGFEYARFLPLISHRANAELARLPLEEKQRLLAERGRPRSDLLPSTAAFVGSDACRSCHAAEYETWSKQPHAHATESLVRKSKQHDPACLTCHTTGFGRPGGFPREGRPEDHPDLARVGCESCHGPGGDHVGPEAPRRGTIVSLGDKCDSCVILQICGACHDEANDPGFEFAVQEKIEAQRHGTIEPGTGRPKQPTARLRDERPAPLAAEVAHAFALSESGG